MGCDIGNDCFEGTATIRKGDGYAFGLLVENEITGAVIPLTGYDFAATLTKAGQTTINLSRTIDAPAGSVSFLLTAAQSLTMIAGDRRGDESARWRLTVTMTDAAAIPRKIVDVVFFHLN